MQCYSIAPFNIMVSTDYYWMLSHDIVSHMMMMFTILLYVVEYSTIMKINIHA